MVLAYEYVGAAGWMVLEALGLVAFTIVRSLGDVVVQAVDADGWYFGDVVEAVSVDLVHHALGGTGPVGDFGRVSAGVSLMRDRCVA